MKIIGIIIGILLIGNVNLMAQTSTISTKGKLKKYKKLPEKLRETSGLAYFNQTLWTINDGGNTNELFQIDEYTGKILKRVVVTNSKNRDWESLASDKQFIYIGDFGNNNGSRKNLRILKIKKSAICADTLCRVKATIIQFNYPEQQRFDTKLHNFDCEGMFVYKNQLHLFTKNRGNSKTEHYTLPTKAGIYKAKLRSSLAADCMITGADIHDGKVVLIGYHIKSFKVLMWVLYDFKGIDFFKGKALKLSMGKMYRQGQTEGIVFTEKYKGYVSSEKLPVSKQKLRKFNLKSYFEK